MDLQANAIHLEHTKKKKKRIRKVWLPLKNQVKPDLQPFRLLLYVWNASSNNNDHDVLPAKTITQWLINVILYSHCLFYSFPIPIILME